MRKEIAYYNGTWGDPEHMTIPLRDRAYFFGEGVYEAILAFNGVLWLLEDHLDRLERSLDLMEMKTPLDRRDLISLMERAVSQVEGPDMLLYLQVSRGDCGPRQHSYAACANNSCLMMTASQFQEDVVHMEVGGAAILYPDLRWAHCHIKTINLIPNVMAATAAERAGADSAILHREGMVTEGCSNSIFIAKDGTLYTRPLSEAILPSVTRKYIVERAEDWGLPLREEEFSVERLLAADEVMIVSTAHYPLPLLRVDGQVIGQGRVGPIARRIYEKYRQDIAQACGPRK